MCSLRTGRKFSLRERQCLENERIKTCGTKEERLPSESDKNNVINSKTLDVYVDVDPSLKGWTENSEFSYKNQKHSKLKRESMDSIYCEVLNNGNCHECQTNERKSASINSSLARFPDLETGGYLLFQSLSEKQKFPERTTYSALSFTSSASSYCSSETSGALRQQVRAASAVLSNFNRRAIESARSFSQARPMTSKNVRFEDVSRNHGRSFSSRGCSRKTSTMSQEGWSKKQIEAWKLLAPTPPQIEVSQMNVSMYTPKELPGIKIFDESLFVI
ncbi:uncharacterized protein LOC114530888 [Dendronephthya gigantea]|uniref:uncharacterized protein LOC114530888 n=1 Tax=Dendronephthya gigantea TaxID=151771 RepID=UPI00106A6C18|nr:uncharacterized protein LOC114530888 [Dendronephthya gigantea]